MVQGTAMKSGWVGSLMLEDGDSKLAGGEAKSSALEAAIGPDHRCIDW